MGAGICCQRLCRRTRASDALVHIYLFDMEAAELECRGLNRTAVCRRMWIAQTKQLLVCNGAVQAGKGHLEGAI